MFSPIIATSQPITLVGAASLEPADLNISLKYAPTLVAADGGADHVLAAGLVPEAVIGDLDSLSDDAKFAFRDVLHPVAEQDTTDFEKALARIDAPLILALGFMGGRLDHTLAALNAVVRHACPVLVIGSDDVAFVAPKAMQLALPAGTRVGLLPFGAARVTTTGLKWDLDDALLEIAGAISSSNAVASDTVAIRSEGQLLITLPKQHLPEAINAVRAE